MELLPATQISVLILTFNEESNIRRVLDQLTWAEKVLVIDSYSTDATIKIIEEYTNTEIRYRVFDSFANQCNYGVSILNSKWVLSLDADYVLPNEFISELTTFATVEQSPIVAYLCRFHFLVFGKRLINDNTTPRAVLFKPSFCSYYNDGHAHRLQIEGATGNFVSKILHDDRKPLSRWLNSQSKYSIQEAEKLAHTPNNELSFISKIRKTKIFAPFFVFFYCLFIQGLIFNGWRGWHYTLQRTIVEMLFALRMIENDKLRNKT